MKEDEWGGTSEQQKKKKHKKGEQSSECDQLANNVEQEEMQPVLQTEHKKMKQHFEDGETGAERKKKKQEVKDYKSVNCQTQGEEDLYFTHFLYPNKLSCSPCISWHNHTLSKFCSILACFFGIYCRNPHLPLNELFINADS